MVARLKLCMTSTDGEKKTSNVAGGAPGISTYVTAAVTSSAHANETS